MSIIPADAATKPIRDFYADLSKEEREAEGLPAAETEKQPEPAAAPVKEAQPAASPEKEPAPSALDQIGEDIAGLREDIASALGAPPRAETEEEPDTLLQEALEHDDPVVRRLGERLAKAEDRLAQTEQSTSKLVIDRHEQQLNAEFDEAKIQYTIGGKPLSDEHVSKIEDVMLARPDLARALTVPQLVRVVFPDAVAVTGKAAPAPPAPGGVKTDAQPVATIVDTGTSGGAAAQPWKPRPNESIESAVQAAASRFGWKR